MKYQHLKCLIVDTAVEIRNLLKAALLPDNDQVYFANDTREGFQLALAIQPDLIIAASGLREDGEELCCQIRQEPALAETLFILTTTSSDRKEHYRYFEKECDQIVMKPFRSHDIFNAIQKAEKRKAKTAGQTIHVLYKTGQADYVDSDSLDQLLEDNDILCFRRQCGVALVGRDPVRQKHNPLYDGPERRHNAA